MAENITITINGKQCSAKDGEFILNVARANDIFIPAICYQTKCSPTLACRLCLVEANGKQVYSCNTKAKDGMSVQVDTPNILKERRAIMEVYDVNHPLQCGVCDRSGECELQNYTLYMQVDSQNYAVKDVHRATKHWGVMDYDPGLCIVCEKCVTICKDMIGSSALSTVKRGADALEKEYKASMPKDAYAMWNKLNKSLIGFDEDRCISCGECIAVCPVGAMVSSDFKYKSNAWELTKIPASNPYSSDCSLIYYEVKQISIEKNKERKIYRVTNDAHYVSLNGAARFGFDYINKATKDSEAFSNAIEAIKGADTIVFNSYITNEEAYMLQLLKEKLGKKLVNNDALRYKNFLKHYSSVSGKSLYTTTLDDIHNANFLISIGSFLKSDAPSVKYAFNNAITMNKGAGLYFHSLGDTHIEGFGKKGKTIETIINKPFSEDAILYFILDQFGENLPADIEKTLESYREKRVKTVVETIKEKVVEKVTDKETGETKEVTKMVPKKVSKEVEFTYTKLLDLIGSNESLLDTMEAMLLKKDNFALIIGEDCIANPNSANLAKLAALVEKYTPFKVIIPPTQTNTLGVSLLCDLDKEIVGKTVGYNVEADFILSGLGDGDIDMPAPNQIEGTFTSINKRVVPTNAAIEYKGYELNDIVNNLLDTNIKFAIDYTSKIFAQIPFDKLENYYANDWSEKRGYCIENNDTNTIKPKVTLKSNNLKANKSEYIIYNGNPINQFNEFTAVAIQLKNDIVALYVSKELATKLEIDENSQVEVTANGSTITVDIRVDNSLIGDIPYLATFDRRVETSKLFSNSRFSKANIKKV
jgi:NADH-quinone oxidoreductase subunit G